MRNVDLPPVVYIGGFRRTGSTLLGILLGKASGFLHVGEISFLKSVYSSSERTACACGRTPRNCEFWRGVMKAYVRNRRGEPDIERAWVLQRRFERRRGLARLLLAQAMRRRKVLRYRRHVRALHQSLAESTTASFVVDSSKCMSPVAWRPILLDRIGGIDVRMIHLIRDGRGVMWSARKGSNRSLELGTATNSRAQIRAWNALIGWTASNMITVAQRRLMDRQKSILVRYEDLASDPAGELLRIGRWLQADLSGVVEALESGSGITAGHALGGNRIRHDEISSIEPDHAWKRHLPKRDRMLYRFLLLSQLLPTRRDTRTMA